MRSYIRIVAGAKWRRRLKKEIGKQEGGEIAPSVRLKNGRTQWTEEDESLSYHNLHLMRHPRS